MTYRPYPNRDRALAHVRRQNPNLRSRSALHRQLAPSTAAALEKAGEVLGQFVRAVRQDLQPGYPTDEYRLSTR
jgi:hypothetical protein